MVLNVLGSFTFVQFGSFALVLGYVGGLVRFRSVWFGLVFDWFRQFGFQTGNVSMITDTCKCNLM